MKKETLTKRITIRLTPKQRENLEMIAKEIKCNLTYLIVKALKDIYHI